MDFSQIFHTIDTDLSCHSRRSPLYQELKKSLHLVMSQVFCENGPQSYHFPSFGKVILPYYNMGNVDTVNLFDLDELIIFSIYTKLANSSYKTAMDIGANMGLHSIVLSNLSYSVKAYEPDPVHFSLLTRNLQLNNASSTVHPQMVAVSSENKKAEFTRVLGNTTGSHLSTAKQGAYGKLEKFEVDVISIEPHLAGVDLVKLDAEGEEYNIVSSISASNWDHIDIVAEIGTESNAHRIWSLLEGIGVNIFSQISGWKKVNRAADLPLSYKDGSVFMTRKGSLPWVK